MGVATFSSAGLSAGTTALGALSGLVMVSPQATVGYQPQNPANADGTPSLLAPPPAFLFHYEGDQAVSLDSDITDHFVEDNTAVQDQIALKPEVVTTQGFIGELNDVPPKILGYLQDAANRLDTIGAYAPQVSTTAQLAYNEAFSLYQTAKSALNAGVAAVASIGNLVSGGGGQAVVGASGLQTTLSPQNLQQQAFQQFYGYWRSRTLFTVQTPWCVFQSMAIKSLHAEQDEKTNVITSFKVSFKMIRTASTSSLGLGRAVSAGRLQSQSADPTSIGPSSPAPDQSFSSGLSTMTT